MGRIRNLRRAVDLVPPRGVFLSAVGLLVAVGLITGWVLGVPRLEAYASALQWKDDVEIRFVDPPAWVKGDLESKLVLTAARHVGGDALKREGLVAAREALLATGWFDEIPQVRRIGAGLVEINARFAEPFAVIRDGAGPNTAGRDHLVDARGRLLPRSFPAGRAGRFVAIVGARFKRPARPGLLWEGADVRGALRLLQLIHHRTWRDQVAEIDIAENMQQYRLITDRGCQILWGRAPDDERGREVPAPRKLGYLDYHHRQYGHIDRGFLKSLDITGDVVIGR
ncbi:MAG: hypothetical protein ACYS0G_14045 [Planctomycetota bacterium]|jgi:hypothetical protein